MSDVHRFRALPYFAPSSHVSDGDDVSRFFAKFFFPSRLENRKDLEIFSMPRTEGDITERPLLSNFAQSFIVLLFSVPSKYGPS